MTSYGANFAAQRKAGEFRVRIFTRDLVVEGTIITVKEKPRLSDNLNDPKVFLNVTDFEAFPKALWFQSVSTGAAPAPLAKGSYMAVGKAQIESLNPLDPSVNPDTA